MVFFVPSEDKLLKTRRLIARKDKEEVTEIVNRLKTSVDKKMELEGKFIEWQKALSQLQEVYAQLVVEVEHKTTLIKNAIQKAILNPPVSLTNEYQKSREEFKALEKASDKMLHLLEKEAVSAIELAQREIYEWKTRFISYRCGMDV